MRHLSDAELAAIALYGMASLELEHRDHLDSCPHCLGEAAAFSAIGSTARSQDTMEKPPTGLWERITADLGEELPALKQKPVIDPAALAAPFTVPRAESAGQNAQYVPKPVSEEEAPLGRHGSRVNRERLASGREPRRHPRRAASRKRTMGWIAGAAISGFLLGAALAAGAIQWSGRDKTEIMEQASLEPLPGWDAQGTARVEDSAGRLQLVVDLPDSSVSGFREVWLLDLAGKTPGLLSVGIMNGDRGVFDLPPGVDLTKFNVVDVSHEPFDGNPAHSSDSIVRGELGSLG